MVTAGASGAHVSSNSMWEKTSRGQVSPVRVPFCHATEIASQCCTTERRSAHTRFHTLALRAMSSSHDSSSGEARYVRRTVHAGTEVIASPRLANSLTAVVVCDTSHQVV